MKTMKIIVSQNLEKAVQIKILDILLHQKYAYLL